jgi:hypothetical protein
MLGKWKGWKSEAKRYIHVRKATLALAQLRFHGELSRSVSYVLPPGFIPGRPRK